MVGGLYLAAVLDHNEFVGLTTVHPSTSAHHLRLTGKFASISSQVAGITQDGYAVEDLTYGRIGTCIGSEEELNDWHIKFRDNIQLCRNSARDNGPNHIEIHARCFGPGKEGNKHNVKTEPKLSLHFAQACIEDARKKKHDQCGQFCGVLAFDIRS